MLEKSLSDAGMKPVLDDHAIQLMETIVKPGFGTDEDWKSRGFSTDEDWKDAPQYLQDDSRNNGEHAGPSRSVKKPSEAHCVSVMSLAVKEP